MNNCEIENVKINLNLIIYLHNNNCNLQFMLINYFPSVFFLSSYICLGCLQWALILEGERERLGWVRLGQVNQARGLSAATRQFRGQSAAARQARGPTAAARQAISFFLNAHHKQPRCLYICRIFLKCCEKKLHYSRMTLYLNLIFFKSLIVQHGKIFSLYKSIIFKIMKKIMKSPFSKVSLTSSIKLHKLLMIIWNAIMSQIGYIPKIHTFIKQNSIRYLHRSKLFRQKGKDNAFALFSSGP